MNFKNTGRNLSICALVFVTSGCCLLGGRNLEDYSIRERNSSPIDGVELLLELDKTVFQQDESVEGKLTLINRRSTDVTINSRFATALKQHPAATREVYFDITRDGKELQPVYFTLQSMNWVTKESFVTLKPGEAWSAQTWIMKPIPLPIEKGHYKAYAIYENYFGPEFGITNALIGTVKSNEVEFVVE